MANYLVETGIFSKNPGMPKIKALLNKHELASSNADCFSLENKTLLRERITDLRVLMAERDSESAEFTHKTLWKHVASIAALSMAVIYLLNVEAAPYRLFAFSVNILAIMIFGGLFIDIKFSRAIDELNEPHLKQIWEIQRALKEAEDQKDISLSKDNDNINIDNVTSITRDSRLSLFYRVNKTMHLSSGKKLSIINAL